jgi:hypothetical protein
LPRTKLEPAAQPVININTQAAPAEPPETPETQPKEDRPPRWFFDEIFSLPQQDWGRVWSMELHRLEPKVAGVPGSKGYLCMFLEPINLMAIQARYGGGHFRLNLCKNGKWFKSHEFDIEGQPIYDASRERPNANGNAAAASGNADFQKEFISVLREELQRSRESTQGTPQGTDEVVKMLTSASDKAMEIVTKQTPQAQSGVSQIKEMVSALKDLGLFGISGAPTTNPLLDKLLAAAIDRLLAPPPAPKSLKEQLEEAKMIAELVGGGEGSPKDWRAMGVKALVDHLPEILDTLKTTSTNTISAAQARAAEARSRAEAAANLRGVQQQPTSRPAPAAAQPQPAAPPAPSIRVDGGLQVVPRDSADVGAPTVVVETAKPTPAAEPTTQEEYDTAMKIQVVNMMRMGASGGAIASFLEDVKPELAKDLNTYAPNVITDFFAKDPILKLMVEDPRWNEVLTDAREYLAEDVLVN